MRRPRAAVLVLLALAAPVAAQADTAAAIKQVRAACKTENAAFKASVDATIADLAELIEWVEGFALAGNFSAIVVDDFAAALDGLQETVQLAALDSALAMAAAQHDALAALPESALDGGLPEGLGLGNGGALDDGRALLRKTLEKAYRKLGRRLDKLEALVEQESGWSLQIAVAPPRVPSVAATQVMSDALLHELSIDLLLSASDSLAAGDGHLWIGGTSYAQGIEVVFFATAMEELMPAFQAQDETWTAGRALAHLEELPESNYLVSLMHAAPGGSQATGAFGVR